MFTNAGSADSPALADVVVRDDNGTPADPADDFSPTFVGGDTNGNGLLDLGETWTYTATRTIPAGATDPFVNVATVTASPQGFPNVLTASDDHSINLSSPQADLAVIKTVDNPTPAIESIVTFTVLVRNNGPDGATGVRVTDPLPAGLTFVSATPSQGSYDPVAGIWDVGALAAGAAATLQIQARVVSILAQPNTATAIPGGQLDPDLSNN